MQKLSPGKLTISRVNTTTLPKDYVCLTLRKEGGGGIEIVVQLEEFALAVTGMARQTVSYREIKKGAG